MFLIYALTDPRTGAVRYIGKSAKGLRRPKEHASACLLDGVRTHKANWIRELLAAGLKYGISVLQRFDSVEPLEAAERAWIAHGRAQGWPLTNSDNGGVGSAGRVLSDETRAKISVANTGRTLRKRTPEEINATRALHLGKKRSPETCARISAALKGKTLGVPKSAEHSARISAALKGKPKSEAHRAALADAQRLYLKRRK